MFQRNNKKGLFGLWTKFNSTLIYLHIPGVVTYSDHYVIKCNICFLVMKYFGHMFLYCFYRQMRMLKKNCSHNLQLEVRIPFFGFFTVDDDENTNKEVKN